MITLFIGIAIAAILVSGVVLPAAFSPVIENTGSVADTAKLTNVSYSNGNQSYVLTTTTAKGGATGTLVVTYESAAKRTNITYGTSGTTICELDGTSPDTCTSVTVTDGANRFNFTSPETTNYRANITGLTLSYTQQNLQTSQGWDSGTTALWTVLGIAIVAGFLLFVFKGRD